MRHKIIRLALAALGAFLAATFLIGLHSLLAGSPTPASLLQSQIIRPGGPGCCARGVAPRELDFPYYSLKDGYEAKLLLVSDSPQPVDLTIAIRNSAGGMLTTTATLQPQAKLPFDLAATITSLGGDPTGPYSEGSIAVYYMGTIMPVVGQITAGGAYIAAVAMCAAFRDSPQIKNFKGAVPFIAHMANGAMCAPPTDYF
ncbi:MAG TPA: hypothetical protein VGX94_06085 [Terriglobia bacterium]|nr:hypothetical protein [Terriglobia bacterium]